MSDVKKMLTSVRFYFTVIFVAAFFLGKSDLLMKEITSAVEVFTALGIAIRTFDRTVDKMAK